MRFAGRALIVTGGGSGIGAAVARRFAAEGGRVAVLDLDSNRAAAVADALEGGIAVQVDVADEASVAAAVGAAYEHMGKIDCVCNAAGHLTAGSIDTYPLAEWTRMLAVHATGTFLVCRAALPHLRAASGGSIVNISSVGALMARKHIGAYSAAKGAVLAFSRQLAFELGDDGIRVNVVAPGTVKTGMTVPLWTERGGGDYEVGAERAASDSIQRRIAEPEEIAASVCFLLSADAGFYTGAVLVPDGGMTAI